MDFPGVLFAARSSQLLVNPSHSTATGRRGSRPVFLLLDHDRFRVRSSPAIDAAFCSAVRVTWSVDNTRLHEILVRVG